MKKMKICLSVLLCLMAMFAVVSAIAAEKAPPKVVEHANAVIIAIGSDPVIVQAVLAENQKGKTIKQIKELDKKWTSTPGVADFMTALMESDCGRHLLHFEAANK